MGRGGFRDCFPLHVEINSSVLVGGIGADMPEPASDVGEIDTGFEQMNCSAVTNTVGMEALVFEGGMSFRCPAHILC